MSTIPLNAIQYQPCGCSFSATVQIQKPAWWKILAFTHRWIDLAVYHCPVHSAAQSMYDAISNGAFDLAALKNIRVAIQYGPLTPPTQVQSCGVVGNASEPVASNP